MSSVNRCLLITATSAIILAFGCSSTSSTPSQMDEAPTPISEAGAEVEVSDYKVGQVAAHLSPVYFDTDAAELRVEALDTLSAHAKSIVDHPEWGVLRVEGHCDERGSDAYNLALGTRRARAVERQLVAMGVSPGRLTAQTLGAQRPAVQGYHEEAWRYNRRSELRVEADDTLASASR